VLAGLLTIAVIGGLVYLAENAYNGVPLLSYRTLYASLPDIGHLKQHDPVDIAGVRVGQVLNTSTRNNRALVELQLRGVGPLAVDSKVVVRANGLLGERYVELDPGASRKTLPDGATITEGGGTYTWGIPEMLNLFDPATRTALGNMINGLGQGVIGRGSQLNQAIHVGPPSGANFDTTAYAILGRGSAAADFLPFTNSGMGALNASRNEIADTFSPGATTAQAFVDQRAPIDNLLSFSAGWAHDVANLDVPQRPVFASLRRLALVADKILPTVPQALRSATALLRDTPASLRSTTPLLNEVPSAVPSALRILFSLQPDLGPLKAAFTDLVAPVSTLAEHGCDIQNAATGIRSLVNWGAAPGGHWGPDVGFPVGFIVGPQQGGFIANGGIPFPQSDPYEAPCAYSPGVTMTPQTLLGILDGSFK
jgi:phospholipid/cholesterol/gamma-HCH transport system substrate-binding protein